MQETQVYCEPRSVMLSGARDSPPWVNHLEFWILKKPETQFKDQFHFSKGLVLFDFATEVLHLWKIRGSVENTKEQVTRKALKLEYNRIL